MTAESNKIQTWDAFISYTGEDRDAVAAPLVQLLGHFGLQVWFDKTELRVGDSLRERIDDGLVRSRYGIVVLSHAFFKKHWPIRELNGLAQREVEGQKVILPIWHDIDEAAVRLFSPPLADRVALSWGQGLYEVAIALVSVIRPDVADALKQRASRIVTLSPIRTGSELCSLIAGVHMFQFFNQCVETAEDTEYVAEFLQQAQDWGDIWNDLEAGGRIEAEFSMHKSLARVENAGWTVHGRRVHRRVKIMGGEAFPGEVALLAIVKGNPPAVFVDGNQAMVPRA